jgi:DNA repair exonuclease SbcCD ATPase subunit
MSVEEATLYLSDKGLVSIEGENLDGTGSDSNGAGKSTIINAILWCCYGEAGKSIRADSVINRKAKRNCSVESVWRDNSRQYRIIRYRKDKVGKNGVKVEVSEGENWRDVTKAGAGHVQQQINEILGQDYLTFQASCFAQQDEALDIPAMTDKQLKELLEKVLPFENLDEQYAKATKDVADLTKVIKQLEDDLTFKKWQIEENRRKGTAAVALYKGYDEWVKLKNDEVEDKIKAKHQAINVAKVNLTDVERLYKEREQLEGKITALGDSGIMSTSFIRNELASVINRIDNPKTHCDACGQATSDAKTVIANLEVQKTRLLTELAKAEEFNKAQLVKKEQKAELGRQYGEATDAIEIHEDAEVIISRLRSDIKLLEGQKVEPGANPHKKPVEALGADFRAARSAAKAIEAQLGIENTKLELLEAVQFTYSPKGVRYHMLEKVAPALTQATNKYLNTLTDGTILATWATVTKTTTGDYKEKFTIECSDKGAEVEYGALSGGEKRKVRLACFFALQDLIASRATKNLEIWCGDEIDHALDPAGIERLMSVLDAKTKSKSTILVISHNELRDWIPNVAVVTRKNDVSVITGYLNGR